MAKASGTVYRSDSRERISGATIRVSKGDTTLHTTTDDDGDFSLDIPEAGNWKFVALDEESFPNRPQEVDMSGDQSDIDIYLNRIAGEVDQAAGRTIFWVLLGVLGGLIILYLALHAYLPGVSPSLTSFSIWSTDPLRFLEILLWSLGGILVNKIILIAWYLRSHRFYREGVIMHIGHIVTTPLLVLVTILILSAVTLSFSLVGGNEITIDLSDPIIMVAFAFIIGTSPWPLWRFIEEMGKRFTGQLG